MGFQWDEDKDRQNHARHGISFLQAAQIFRGPVLERPDDWSREEARTLALGESGSVVITVVYTWRGGDRRIISAWKATRHDREVYYKKIYGQI